MTNTLTLCFAGTDCWPTQGLDKDQEEYNPVSGYIPAKLHQSLQNEGVPSFIIPGCGKPYNKFCSTLKVRIWNLIPDISNKDGEPTNLVIQNYSPPTITGDDIRGLSVNYLAAHAISLIVGAPVQYLEANIQPDEIEAQSDPKGEDVAKTLGLMDCDPNRSMVDENPRLFWKRPDLAAINAPQRIDQVNMIGHSRGGVVALAVANMIAEYLPHIQVNLIGLDPVPGTGNWPKNMCTLPQSVLGHYLGIYAIDETSMGFNAVVPAIAEPSGNRWEPLTSATLPTGLNDNQYQLVFSRGRHATIPGSQMNDGADFNKAHISKTAGSVGELVHYLSLKHLRQWGTTDNRPGPTAELVNALKATIEEDGANKNGIFYSMRDVNYGGKTLNQTLYQKARGVSDCNGRSRIDLLSSLYHLDFRWRWQYLEACLPTTTPIKLGYSENADISPIMPAPFKWQALTKMDNSEFGV